MENRGTYYVYYGWGGEKNAFKLASDKKGIKYVLERLNKDRSIEWKEGAQAIRLAASCIKGFQEAFAWNL
jgi:hypothetical protein